MSAARIRILLTVLLMAAGVTLSLVTPPPADAATSIYPTSRAMCRLVAGQQPPAWCWQSVTSPKTSQVPRVMCRVRAGRPAPSFCWAAASGPKQADGSAPVTRCRVRAGVVPPHWCTQTARPSSGWYRYLTGLRTLLNT